MEAPIDKCPHCGNKEGFYTRETASGTVIYRTGFKGEELENGHMYDLVTYKGGISASKRKIPRGKKGK